MLISIAFATSHAAKKSQVEHISLPHSQVERDASVSDLLFKMLTPITPVSISAGDSYRKSLTAKAN